MVMQLKNGRHIRDPDIALPLNLVYNRYYFLIQKTIYEYTGCRF
jgi:hypothetical protein